MSAGSSQGCSYCMENMDVVFATLVCEEMLQNSCVGAAVVTISPGLSLTEVQIVVFSHCASVPSIHLSHKATLIKVLLAQTLDLRINPI